MEHFRPHPLLILALNALVFVVSVVVTCAAWGLILHFIGRFCQ